MTQLQPYSGTMADCIAKTARRESSLPLCLVILKGWGIFQSVAGKKHELGPHSPVVPDQGEVNAIRAPDQDLVFAGFTLGEKAAPAERVAEAMARSTRELQQAT